MSEKNDATVVCLGEILVDFTSVGISDAGQPLYECNPGGAPANVAAAVARLGGRSAFIGTVGSDPFGVFLRTALVNCGVDVRGLGVCAEHHTTLAFVNLAPDGERSFSFCRSPGADTTLSPESLDPDLLTGCRFLHVGSLSLTREPARSATMAAIERVRASGGLICVDPNWRPNLWPDRDTGIRAMKSLVQHADILKVSDEELPLLTGTSDPEYGARLLLQQGPSLVLVTLGKDGAFVSSAADSFRVPAPEVSVLDTTGAGDSFVGGLLFRLSLMEDPLHSDSGALRSAVAFANAVAALCVTRRGAISALPDLQETTTFLRSSL